MLWPGRLTRDARQRSRFCCANSGTYFRLLLVCAKALAAADLVFAGVLGLLNNAEAFLVMNIALRSQAPSLPVRA